MTSGLKLIRTLLLTISFLAIGLATLTFITSLFQGAGRSFLWSLDFYGLALALPLIGIWLAGRISTNVFLVARYQQNFFRFFAVFSSLALAFQLVEALTNLSSGNTSILQSARFVLSNSLLITLLAACSIWPTDNKTLETMEDIFE